jgi:pyruvate-formate lyase-activating enzyme
MHLFVDGFGYFYNCCFGISQDAYSKDSEGSPISAGEPGAILRHWNSPAMTELRRKLRAGERARACTGCWRVEETGSRSFRSVASAEYPVAPETVAEDHPQPVFRYLDLRFGNLCNLACRMCVPYTTRKLFDEHARLYGEATLAPYRNMNWFEAPHFWDELHQYRHGVEKIHLAGGEPLIIKECWDFLRRLAEDPCAKNITLSYNTNLSHIPPQAKELWPRFKGVVLLVSMDGVGPVNDFIRYPLKWNDFERNLRTIEDEFEAYNVINCHVQPTVQAYNIRRIVEICEYLATYRKIQRYPLVNLLFDPPHLSAGVLPRSYREAAATELEAYAAKVEAGWNELSDWDRGSLATSLRGILAYLRGDDKSLLFREFQRMNDLYDQTRGQRILDFLPELIPLYGR